MDGINACNTLLNIKGSKDPIEPPIKAPINAIINEPQKLPRKVILNTKKVKIDASVPLIK